MPARVSVRQPLENLLRFGQSHVGPQPQPLRAGLDLLGQRGQLIEVGPIRQLVCDTSEGSWPISHRTPSASKVLPERQALGARRGRAVRRTDRLQRTVASTVPVVSEIMPGSTLPTPIAPHIGRDSRRQTGTRSAARNVGRPGESIGPKSVPARTIAGRRSLVDLESGQHLGIPLAAMDVDQARQPRRARLPSRAFRSEEASSSR